MCQGWTTTCVDEAVLRSFQLDDLKPFVEAGTTPKAFADQVMVETLKADVRAHGECWQSMLDEDHSAELAEVALPVLIVWGTADGVFVASLRRLYLENWQTALFYMGGYGPPCMS